MILYRHFDSKADLYRSVLDRAKQRLDAAPNECHRGRAARTGDDSQPFT